MQDLKQIILEHRQLLQKFRDSSIDLQSIDPDEDGELFGQIIEYRNKLLDLMEPLFLQIKQNKSALSPAEYQSLTAESNALSEEISTLDAQNEIRLLDFKKSIAGELKQVATNSRAFSGYQAPRFISGKTIDHL